METNTSEANRYKGDLWNDYLRKYRKAHPDKILKSRIRQAINLLEKNGIIAGDVAAAARKAAQQ